jgi:hypothetical protein
MVHTLENLMEFHGADAKGIIWEHNTILEMRELRICVMMEHVGQIINEEHKPEECFQALVPTRLLLDVSGDVMQVMQVPEGKAQLGI